MANTNPTSATRPRAVRPAAGLRGVVGAAVVTLASLAVDIAAQDAPLVIGSVAAPITPDGDLREWPREPSLRLDRRDQVWSDRVQGLEWGGVDDLSASLWLAYDASHLYFAGRVTDDDLFPGEVGLPWHQQDAIELFLHFAPRDPAVPNADGAAALASGNEFDDQSVQFFVMPFSVERQWGAVDWRSTIYARPAPGLTGLTGVRVGHRVADDRKSYTFEVVLPFHNLPALPPGGREIGFNVAIDDRDAATDRYQYMTWNGQNPVDNTALLGVLRFGGVRPPLADAPEPARSWTPGLVADAPFVLLPLVGLMLLLLALRLGRVAERRLPSLVPIGRVVGLLVFALGLALPAWLESRRRDDGDARLRGVVATVRDELPAMETSALGTFQGSQRDRPLITLFSGGAISPERKFGYTLLEDVAGEQAGVHVRPFPGADVFDVRPYWIPLEPDLTERFAFATPLEPGTVNVVLARPQPSPFFDDPSPTPVPTISVTRRSGVDDDAEPVTDAIEFLGPFEVGDDFGLERRVEVGFESVVLDEPVRSIGITPGPNDSDLLLVGLTWVSPDGTESRPLRLGDPTSGLRGPWPEDSGFVLRSGGGKRSIAMPPPTPERDGTYDSLWLYYRATYPGRSAEQQDVVTGQLVGRLTVRFADAGRAPVEVEFRHQESVLFERARFNSAEPKAPVRVAFTWEDELQEARINLVRQVDLPRGAKLSSLEFENVGPYPMRFRSIVLGEEVQTFSTSTRDSPLVRDGGGDGRGYRLREDLLERLEGADFAVYRGGRLVDSTLTDVESAKRTDVPEGAQRGAPDALEFHREVADGDGIVHEAYAALTDEGWSGAVLGVIRRDGGFGDYVRWLQRIGWLLCVFSAPMLLLAFSDVLGVLNNLRLRLVLVLSVATLVPLALLSFLLVQVLEAGHESDLQRSMRQAVATAKDRIEAEKELLRTSGESWLADLVPPFQGLLTRSGGDADAIHAEMPPLLTPILQSQLPPAWSSAGGYLRFEYQRASSDEPVDPSADTAQRFDVFVGGPDLEHLDVRIRPEPGVFLPRGVPLLGVRCDHELADGRCSLTVVRRLDETSLAALVPDEDVVLCDVQGYPLVIVDADGANAARERLAKHAVRPTSLTERVAARAAVLDGGQPVVRRHRFGAASWVAGYDVVRDLQDSARLILGVVRADQPATLSLAIGPVPVRGFFLAAGALLFVLSVFLSFLVTSRITTPIDRLEAGAQSMSRGQLDVSVPTDAGGQIGRLARTFNQMARDLRLRIQDLHLINRGTHELNSRLELSEAITGAITFFVRHSPADRVQILLLDRERDRVEVYGGGSGSAPGFVDRAAPDVRVILAAEGPCDMRFDGTDDGYERELARHFSDYRSTLVLPLVFAGRSRGAVLLLFETAYPTPVNLDVLWTMARQAAVAVENARLYRGAVEDVYTGAFRPEFFRTRVVQEVARAQDRGRRVALGAVRIRNGDEIARTLGKERHGRFLGRIVDDIRSEFGAETAVCRTAEDDLQVLIPPAADGAESARATDGLRSALERLVARWSATADLPREPSVRTAVVAYPEDAASAEFLFDALDVALSDRGARAELDETRLRLLAEEGAFVGSSAMEGVLRTLDRVAPTDLTVLLEGETGTGKEVIANLTHRMSTRASGPLVKVHCAALPESLLQSELFGHEKGAFTGAHERKIGRFERAQGGTIFLDEIGEISLDVQVKLLRVLQEREIDRVGGTRPVPVDVRVIAATHRNLADMVRDGGFREDLYYRLQGMIVRVPSLRERKGEIPGLIELFRVEAVAAGHTRVEGFHPDAIDALFRHDWPGNIRELRNTVFRAMVLAAGPVVTAADLEAGARGEVASAAPAADAAAAPDGVEAVADEARPPPAGGEAPAVVLPTPAPAAAAAAAAAAPTARPRSPELPPRLEAAYAFVAEHGAVSTRDYATAVGVSDRTALRDLNALQDRGLIARHGKRKGARYVLATVANGEFDAGSKPRSILDNA